MNKHGRHIRLALAFLVAPALPSAMLALAMSKHGQFIIYFALVSVVAYALTFFIAAPVFAWLYLTKTRFTLGRIALCAFAAVALPFLIFGLVDPGDSPDLTASDRVYSLLLVPALGGALAAMGGLIFWFIARAALRTGNE
jgi:hypothetical protein